MIRYKGLLLKHHRCERLRGPRHLQHSGNRMALVEDGAPGKPAVFRPRRTLKWPRRWIVESGSNPTALQRQCSSAQHTSVAAYRRCAASLGTTSAWSFPRRAQCRALRIFFCSRFSGRGRYCDRAHLQLLAALRPRQSPLPLPGPVLFCRRGDRVLFPRSFVSHGVAAPPLKVLFRLRP